MNRPMMWVAGSFALGVAVTHGLWFDDWRLVAPIAVLAATWVFAAARVRGGGLAFAVVVLAFVIAGGARYAAGRYGVENDPLRVFLADQKDKTITVAGKAITGPLLTASDRAPQVTIFVDSVTVDGTVYAVSGNVLIRSRFAENVCPGDNVTATGIATPPLRFRPRADPYRRYLERRGIVAVIDPAGKDNFVSTPYVGTPDLRRTMFDARRHIMAVLGQGLDDREKHFIAAVWLGEKRAIPDTISETLINTGTYHIACVSGIHLAIVAAAVSFVLQSLGFSSRKESVCVITVVVIFTAMAGMRLPVCRAAFMLITYYLARTVRREGDPLNSISLAAFVLLVVQPLNLFDTGFQLSFMAVFTLIVMRRRGVHRSSAMTSFVGQGARSAFLISLAIFVVSLPVVMRTFKTVSFVSPVTNVFATPMMAPILILTTISTGIGLVWPAAAIVFNGANRLIIDLLIFVLEMVENVPGTYIRVAPPPLYAVMLYYAGLAVLLTRRVLALAPKDTVVEKHETGIMPMRRRGPIAAIIFSLAIFAWVVSLPKHEHRARNAADLNGPVLSITAINVGQGDSFFLEFPNGQNLLVDAGPAWQGNDAGESRIVPFLRYNGIEYLNGVVLTHGHMDHVGGMASVLEAIPAGAVFSTGASWDIPAYDRFIDVMDRRDVPHETLIAGDRLEFGDDVIVETVYPTAADLETYAGDPNNLSIVLMVTFGKTEILLTGDMTGTVEKLLIERGTPLDADVLKVPHNGSARASTPEFLEEVGPSIAVLPVGANNAFGFPSDELVDRYKSARIPLFRTDRHGHIRVTTDGTTIKWETTTQNTGTAKAR